MKKIFLFSTLILFSCSQNNSAEIKPTEKELQKPTQEINKEEKTKPSPVNETTHEDLGNGLIVIDGDTLEKDCTCGDPSLHLK